MAVNTTESVESFTPKRTKKSAPLVSEGQMDQDVRATASALDEQPKRLVRLYKGEPGKEPLPDEFVHVNGHGYLIQRGVEVEIPQTVYEVLVQSGRI